MSIGQVLLCAATILVLFGVGQRLLDKLRLKDRAAAIVMAAILLGGFVPDIPLGGGFSVNVGGALIPFGLCVYLWVRADTRWERIRSLLAGLLSGAAIVALGLWLPAEPETMFMDPNYLYGITGGIIAYVLGRSRRAAYIAGTLGVIFADVYQGIVNLRRGVEAETALGGAGGFDAVIIAGFLALMLAELAGELTERGKRVKHPDQTVKDGEFVPRRDGNEA